MTSKHLPVPRLPEVSAPVVLRSRTPTAEPEDAGPDWRRIASAMWQRPNDPQIFGALEIDATAALRFMEGCRALGHKVTPTHLVGRAVALTLRVENVFDVDYQSVFNFLSPRRTILAGARATF